MDLIYGTNGFLLLQHANGENAWVGLDGRSGDIVDMKERKVHLSLHLHTCQLAPNVSVLV
jgi:hypothetical protein